MHTYTLLLPLGTWVWTWSNTRSFLQQTALPALWMRAKLHHGYALAMVTLPKCCCGSASSPWIRINPHSVFWSRQICLLRETFSCRLGALTTCLCCLYCAQFSGWVHFKSLIGHMYAKICWGPKRYCCSHCTFIDIKYLKSWFLQLLCSCDCFLGTLFDIVGFIEVTKYYLYSLFPELTLF